MMKYMRLWVGLSAFLVIGTASVMLAGCPDDGVLSDGVVLVDEVDALAVTGIADDLMTFESGLDALLQVGDIVVGSADGGYLRRIVALGKEGKDIFAQTEQASIAEAVDQGLMMANVTFDAVEEKGDGPLLDFSGQELYRDYGIVISLATATLDCDPNVYVAASFANHRLESFNFSAGGTVTLDLDVRAAVDEGYPLAYETDLAPPITQPFATMIGPLPVYGVASLRFPIGVVGYFDGDTSIQAGFDVSTDFSLTSMYEDGKWDNDAGVGPWEINGHAPIWSLEVGADIQVYVKVIAAVTLYSAADVSVWAQPYLNADLVAYPAPQSVALVGGINLGGCYGLTIFDYTLLGDCYTWYGPSAELWAWSSDQ